MIQLTDALLALRPEGGYRIEDDESIEYFGDSTNKPTLKEIKAKQIELQAEYDSQQYARDRASEYPPIKDVVVALAEKAEGRPQMWDEISAMRLDVKSTYPKPE